ncbi:DUF4238 domain-containing protein [Alteromonas sp.]|uniref:DUF4238 domain-containing protein n=1 Tax=Alteromonas sp. TaxID=232 RepID=UPI003F4C0094
MSNKPKKQHYVPQFLLKNWSKGKKEKIHIFDKKENKVFSSSVRDAGHENNFYEDEILGYQSNTEIKLAELETIAAPIIKKIITEGNLKLLSPEEHWKLCFFTSVQMLRTNHTREFLQGFQDILNERIIEWGADPKTDVENYKEISKEEIKSSSINILNTLPIELVDEFVDKQLTLLVAPDNHSFYISDNPIVKHNHFPRPHRGNLGISLEGIEIYFPISPRYCLSFLCSKLATEMKQKVMNYKAQRVLGCAPLVDISEAEAEAMVDCFTEKTQHPMSPLNMDFNNSQQVIHSTRFIYSSESDFALAKDMLRTNPEISTQPKVVDGSKVF